MAVYIAVHKEAPLPRQAGYIPLQVGACLHPRLQWQCTLCVQMMPGL